MPCSQMISMNIRPPRATADRKVESVPKVKARMRNSGSLNIGSATRFSIEKKAAMQTAAAPSRTITRRLPHPVA